MSDPFGVDYAFGTHPSTNALKAAGAKFVCRYISSNPANDTNGKNLLPAERQALQQAGIEIVVVVEEDSGRMLGGHATGVTDAKHADAVVKALGMAGVPIYFACDFDATPGNQTAINAYLDGAASVIGVGRVGIYGGYWPCVRAWQAKKVRYVWQTYAWSGLNIPGNKADLGGLTRHVFQYSNGHTLAGASVDYDTARETDFGQWPRPSIAPVGPVRHEVASGNKLSVVDLAASRNMTEAGFLAEQANFVTAGDLSADHMGVLTAMAAAGTACRIAGLPRPPLVPGTIYWTNS